MERLLWLKCVVIFCWVYHTTIAHAEDEEVHGKDSKILQRIFKTFDPNEPSENRESFLSLLITDIPALKERSMVWDVKMEFNHTWTNERLAFTEAGVNESIAIDPDLMLPPDPSNWKWIRTRIPNRNVYIPNSRLEALYDHKIEGTYARLWKDGQILRSDLVTVEVIFCDMDFHGFPFDTQVCQIQFEGPKKWGKGHGARILKNVSLPGWNIIKQRSSVTQVSQDIPRLVFEVGFRRDASYHVATIFTPVAATVLLPLILLLVWKMVLWMRIFICCVSTAGYLTIGAVTWVNHPLLNYMRAMDLYLIGSGVFLILTNFQAIIQPTFGTSHKAKESSLSEDNVKCEILAPILLFLSYTLFNLWFLATYAMEHWDARNDGFFWFDRNCVTTNKSPRVYSSYDYDCN